MLADSIDLHLNQAKWKIWFWIAAKNERVFVLAKFWVRMGIGDIGKESKKFIFEIEIPLQKWKVLAFELIFQTKLL